MSPKNRWPIFPANTMPKGGNSAPEFSWKLLTPMPRLTPTPTPTPLLVACNRCANSQTVDCQYLSLCCRPRSFNYAIFYFRRKCNWSGQPSTCLGTTYIHAYILYISLVHISTFLIKFLLSQSDCNFSRLGRLRQLRLQRLQLQLVPAVIGVHTIALGGREGRVGGVGSIWYAQIQTIVASCITWMGAERGLCISRETKLKSRELKRRIE